MTLLFTDIEGSTRMLDRLGERYGDLLAEHHRLMREAISSTGGREVDTAGDSFFVVFSRASDAVECARHVQLGLASGHWPEAVIPRVRMGIHSGVPRFRDGEYVGMDVHRAARVMGVAHGGQVLLTKEAHEALGTSTTARDLGYHRLKDLPAPEHLFQLLAQGLETDFPTLRSLNRTNLPMPANPLVGRSAEVVDALARLASTEVRLLTLLGPGGAGKTRLALEVASEAVGRYRDGVWLVLLAPLLEPALMVSEIARVLEVEAVPGQPLERALATAVANRELLLLLDNFEHLLDAAGVVAAVLAAAPGVDVIVTSREPLRIGAEHRIEVSPLAPADARELFVQRATAVRPELTVGDDDARAIERMCALLDGLPLALELAAARISIFSPRALEARLAEGLPLPAGSRDLPERQRTLRATIEWSYQLLEPHEQTLLASLSPFVGGLRLADAEQLWGLDGVEGLISLAEKSLLRRREDPDGEPRLWMLETVRQYATEVVQASGAASDVADKHADCFFAVTERARPELVGSNQRHWLDLLELDHANLRAALEHLAVADPDRALRMAAILTWFWDMRGYQPEAYRRLADLLARAPAGSPSRGEALQSAGWMAWTQGEPEVAQRFQQEALPLVKLTGDARLLTQLYSHLATVAEMLRDYDEVMPFHERAIATARAAGDDWALGMALNNLAVVPRLRFDNPRTSSLFEQALASLRRTGDTYLISIVVGNLAELAVYAGDLDRAKRLTDEALSLTREIDFRPLIAGMLELGAVIALEQGDLETATARMQEALDTGVPFQRESVAMRLTLAASLAAIRHQPIRAAALWSAAEHAYAQIGLDSSPIHDRLLARWQAQAQADAGDTASWDAAWRAGTELSTDQALALAGQSDGIELNPR